MSSSESSDDEVLQTFADRFRANGWLFEEYRHDRWMSNIPGTHTWRLFRDNWRNRQLPRRGRVRRERYRQIFGVRTRIDILSPRRHPVARGLGMPNILGPAPVAGTNWSRLWQKGKDRYASAREYFSDTRGLTVVAPLGYGGQGLAVMCEYRRNASAAGLKFVMKMALDSWDSPDLYREGKMQEKFNRATHFVQVIPRSSIGLPQQRPYPHSISGDDSSSSESESGDESYDDQPSQKVMTNARRTRRQQIARNPAEFQNKMRRHNRRFKRLTDLQEEREAHMNDRNPDPKWQVDRKDFLLLEFMENGDLQNLIIRLNDDGKEIPNRVTRACLGMQYPPRKFHPGRHEDHPLLQPNGLPGLDLTETGKRLGDDLFEQEPVARRRWAAKRIVHFDIDPRNILIAGLDPVSGDHEHTLVPRLKLADFGLAEDIKPNKRNEYYENRRLLAKFGYYAPEQFGVEWDHVKQRDGGLIRQNGSELAEQNVAGNYGAHTNIWGIALTMWQLITKFEVPRPPLLQVDDELQDQIPNHYCPDILTDARYNRVDIELRRTVARCMAHDPRSRPRPRTLVAQARKGIRKRFRGETDDMIREWIQEVIFNPSLMAAAPSGASGAGGAGGASVPAGIQHINLGAAGVSAP
ncbi:kinase-like domain-containing protein [Xylaria digitata]|nr:kinase-like domain-containing protein [Xylaria digitata]